MSLHKYENFHKSELKINFRKKQEHLFKYSIVFPHFFKKEYIENPENLAHNTILVINERS